MINKIIFDTHFTKQQRMQKTMLIAPLLRSTSIRIFSDLEYEMIIAPLIHGVCFNIDIGKNYRHYLDAKVDHYLEKAVQKSFDEEPSFEDYLQQLKADPCYNVDLDDYLYPSSNVLKLTLEQKKQRVRYLLHCLWSPLFTEKQKAKLMPLITRIVRDKSWKTYALSEQAKAHENDIINKMFVKP